MVTGPSGQAGRWFDMVGHAMPTDPDALSSHHALVRALMRREAWPEPLPADARFELIETHISSLLLAGDGVLKLKKPLRLPFLDFSTPDLRRHFCEEEVRLNRRTAPQLYRAVLPVTGPPPAPRLGGPGPAIDWALWMHRFDNRQLYDRLAQAGALTADHVDALAAEIAAFHAALPTSPPAFGDPAVAQRWAADNLRELQALAAGLPDAARAQLAALAPWNAARAQQLQPLLAQRRAAGAVVEGHGDLHLGNIVQHQGRPLLFDALEFNPELRHGDRLNDLAFAFMDLLAHGLPRLAWRLLSLTLEASGDHDALPLLRWFASYRALVRAKVALIQAGQAPGVAGAPQRAAALERIELAQRLAFPPAPRIVLTSGLSGSGKSTVALQLAEALGAVRVRSDVERKRLHGLAATERPTDAAQLYNPDSTARTYARLAEVARVALAGGVSVVLDAAFLRRAERAALQRLAAEHGVDYALVLCEASPATLAARIGQRQADGRDPSDADLAVLQLQQRVREPLADGERASARVLDTEGPREAVAARAEALFRAAPAGPAAPPVPIITAKPRA